MLNTRHFVLFFSLLLSPPAMTDSLSYDNRNVFEPVLYGDWDRSPVGDVTKPNTAKPADAIGRLLLAGNGQGSPSDPKATQRRKQQRCRRNPNCRKDRGDNGDVDADGQASTAPAAGTPLMPNGPANPHGGEHNCVTCAWAVDQREGGKKVIATFVKDEGANHQALEGVYGKKFKKVGKTLKPKKPGDAFSDADYDKHANELNRAVAQDLKNLPNGSRAIVDIQRFDGEGHTLNVVSRPDGFHYRDEQDPNDIEEYKVGSAEAAEYLARQGAVSLEMMVTHEAKAPKTPPIRD